jgi:Amt family ammonium transporter
MQLGFAFLEGGSVRYRNINSIMIKVFSNAAIAVIMIWLVIYLLLYIKVGYGFMFGENDSRNFIGTNLFAA